MLLSLSRPVLAVVSGWLVLWSAAQASPSLRDAVEAAWALNPQARALANRQAELEARERAASSLISGPPSMSLVHRTDRVGSNGGLRENEAEIAAPLWTPSVRSATGAQVRADRASFELRLIASKVKVAAQVRELAAQAALARIEQEVAQRQQLEVRQLVADVEQRVKAGEAARVDLLQAQSVQRQAEGAQVQADSALARITGHWQALTGLTQLAALDEAPAAAGEHPFIAAADAQLRAAQAKLALAAADRHDPVELGVGVVRGRTAAGAPNDSSIKLSLRVPLGSHGRNAPKLAAARAEVDAADAEAQAARRDVRAEREAAQGELDSARHAEILAADRQRLAQEIQALIAKFYQLGEGDLPTRVRADGERFAAELAHARARVETRRAISRLNQAFGILP